MRSRLVVKKSKRVYNTPGRMFPGAVFLFDRKRYVLSGNHGPYFRAYGSVYQEFNKRRCKVVAGNKGLVYVA